MGRAAAAGAGVAVVAVAVAVAADRENLAVWAQVLYSVRAGAGPVAWSIVGLSVSAALRRAGVAGIEASRQG